MTELLEQGAPEDTVIALAGWVGRRMVETYSHARIEAKADAVQLLKGFGTKRPGRPDVKLPDAPIFQKPEGRAPEVTVDIMNPAIHAEIARQVALALERERQQSTAGSMDSKRARALSKGGVQIMHSPKALFTWAAPPAQYARLFLISR